MAKLKPGDPLSAISAREYNRHVDAADWYERTQRLGGGGNAALSGLDGSMIKVKNGTGSDLRQYDPVAIGSPAVDVANGYLVFNSSTLNTSLQGGWGVCIDPIPNGEIGRVKIAGAVPCYVTLSDTSWHDHATVSSTPGQLETSSGGPADILYSPLTAGEQLCVLRLGNNTPAAASHGRAHSYTHAWYGTIPNGGDVNVPMWDATTFIESTPGPFTFNGTNFDRLKSNVTGLILATAIMQVEYASSGSATDGVLIGSMWDSTGTWFTGGYQHTLTRSYVRYSQGCVTSSVMFQVTQDQEIWLRLSTGSGLGYFWGTTSDITVNSVNVVLIHLATDFLSP